MKNSKGFTTLELALAMLVFGIMTALLIAGFKIMNLGSARSQTVTAIDTAEAGLIRFQQLNGYYPCPADPAVPRGDPNYGRANCPAAGTAAIPGARDADGDGVRDEILIGAVPFATLMDPDNDPTTDDADLGVYDAGSQDGWGRKFTYAVSRRLTDPAPGQFHYEYGVLNMVDENNNQVLPQPGTAHFILVSHGENGRGGFTAQGRQVAACPPNLTLPGPGQIATQVNEVENCDGDFTFISGLVNETDHSYQDDIARPGWSMNTELWRQIPGSTDIVNTNPGNVGIGVRDPQERLEIDGDLTAAQVDAGLLCDSQGQNCMPADFIGGQAAMTGTYANSNATYSNTCPNQGDVVVGIENNQVVCAPGFTTTGTCAAGEVMIGRSRNGVICCPRNYPVANHPNPHCATNPGCAPRTETRVLACPASLSGQITERRSFTCPANSWGGWVQIANSCASRDCTPRSETRIDPCPSGQTGQVVMKRLYTCPADSWGAWTPVSSNCR